MEAKQVVQDEASACNAKLESAKKLVEGLAGENKRWKESVAYLKKNKIACIGDSLLAAAFVSYIGAFSAKLRLWLWKDTWIKDIEEYKIPMTENTEPLKILTTEA